MVYPPPVGGFQLDGDMEIPAVPRNRERVGFLCGGGDTATAGDLVVQWWLVMVDDG